MGLYDLVITHVDPENSSDNINLVANGVTLTQAWEIVRDTEQDYTILDVECHISYRAMTAERLGVAE